MDKEIAAILAELRAVELECLNLVICLLRRQYQATAGKPLPLLMEIVEQVQVRP